MQLDPVTGVPPIPAMTSQAERECYYRLTLEAKGEVIEFGAWLGAATAYMAAAMRDKGGKVHSYDKFRAEKGHARKAKEYYAKAGGQGVIPDGDTLQDFLANLGPLAEYVQPHQGDIAKAQWHGGPIALIINDAPKRVPEISAVLTNFRSGIVPGTLTGWQDFCHFPSYEIPACLYRLREHFEFSEAVYPGSTLVFRTASLWEPDEVSTDALALSRWTPDEIDAAWEYWLQFVPAKKAPVFRCGRAMFLADTGHMRAAVAALEDALVDRDRVVLRKWNYLRKARPDFVIRYRPLFDCVGRLA